LPGVCGCSHLPAHQVMETDMCLGKYISNKPSVRQQLLNELNCVVLQETFIFINTAVASSGLTNKRLSLRTLWNSWWTKAMGLVFVPAVRPLPVIYLSTNARYSCFIYSTDAV
jgi:peroxiredoxin